MSAEEYYNASFDDNGGNNPAMQVVAELEKSAIRKAVSLVASIKQLSQKYKDALSFLEFHPQF